MFRSLLFLSLAAVLYGCLSHEPDENQASEIVGSNSEKHTSTHVFLFESDITRDRNIEIWLPPGYAEGEKRYPVLYMHDGQNLFNPDTSYTGVDWGVDETMTRLIEQGKVREAIVVGIYNTEKRIPEYIPLVDPLSDQYVDFVVKELQPHINNTYRTLTGPQNTFVMGSSLGGLISAYALARYPQVFGGAACVSTHWPLYDDVPGVEFIDYLASSELSPTKHRIYFDYGTEGLDAQYEPFQMRADKVMAELGFAPEVNWVTRKFEGADHNEQAWADRVHIP